MCSRPPPPSPAPFNKSLGFSAQFFIRQNMFGIYLWMFALAVCNELQYTFPKKSSRFRISLLRWGLAMKIVEFLQLSYKINQVSSIYHNPLRRNEL